jgi:tetratricopeptide (TPR) repeat protein
MRTAANVAWEGHWKEAIQSYQRALAEFPEDINALAGLGMAYANIGRPVDALDAYQRASDLEPDDPVLFERLGETLEQLGRGEEAARAYLASARLYTDRQQSPRLAVGCWERAARVHPGCLDAHVALLKYYQRQRRIRDAVEECLTLAHIYREQGHVDYAVRICQHALQLSPRDTRALALFDRLRYGTEAPQQRDVEESEATPETEPQTMNEISLPDAVTLSFETSAEDAASEETGSPVETTRRQALTDLAESVFEEEVSTATRSTLLSKEAIDALISKAINFQTRGKVDEAIAAYEEIVHAGAELPAVRLNLGLLYQEKLRFDDAISQFERVVSHPDYRLGSYFALGECYRAQGRIAEALESFIQVMKIVDLATVRVERADDLSHLYEHLADGYLAKGDQDQALELANSLVTFLSEQGWEDKVRLARQRLDALTQEGPAVSLAEALTVPGSERILESMALSHEYVKRGMFYTAAEECHFALESAPNYLPLHRQIAEVSLKMGRIDAAVRKLIVVADTYRVRGTASQAAAMYRQALKLAPMDTAVRAKLIELLISSGEIEQALQHYTILADSYYHLAQMDQAREVYEEALRLVPRLDHQRDWTVRILHRIGDLAMQRVDWKNAVSVYQRIRDLAPCDERARSMLMELHYRLNQPRRALEELDQLLRAYQEEDRAERILVVLDDLLERWPAEIALRARLAQAHLDAGHTEEALEHLDKLGDLQLEAGRLEEARSTIQAIIALRPPNVASYEMLLERIETRGQSDD